MHAHTGWRRAARHNTAAVRMGLMPVPPPAPWMPGAQQAIPRSVAVCAGAGLARSPKPTMCAPLHARVCGTRAGRRGPGSHSPRSHAGRSNWRLAPCCPRCAPNRTVLPPPHTQTRWLWTWRGSCSCCSCSQTSGSRCGTCTSARRSSSRTTCTRRSQTRTCRAPASCRRTSCTARPAARCSSTCAWHPGVWMRECGPVGA